MSWSAASAAASSAATLADAAPKFWLDDDGGCMEAAGDMAISRLPEKLNCTPLRHTQIQTRRRSGDAAGVGWGDRVGCADPVGARVMGVDG